MVSSSFLSSPGYIIKIKYSRESIIIQNQKKQTNAQVQHKNECQFSTINTSEGTTSGFICAICTVLLAVTQEVCRQAAGLVVTVMNTAPHQRHALKLIRAVLTLRYTITHLALLDAHLPMGTLELICLCAGITGVTVTCTIVVLHKTQYHNNPNRAPCLQNSGLLVVFKSTIGGKAFSLQVPYLWNQLPA